MKKYQAFSLIEISIVLIILGILLSVGLPSFSNMNKIARHQKIDHNMEVILKSLGAFVAMNGYLPVPDKFEEEGDMLVGVVPENSTFLSTSILLDDFGLPIIYKVDKKLIDTKLRLNHLLIACDFCAAKEDGSLDFIAIILESKNIKKSISRNNFVALYCSTVCKTKEQRGK